MSLLWGRKRLTWKCLRGNIFITLATTKLKSYDIAKVLP